MPGNKVVRSRRRAMTLSRSSSLTERCRYPVAFSSPRVRGRGLRGAPLLGGRAARWRGRSGARSSGASTGAAAGRVRVAQWNIEHGNRCEAIARASRSQAALAAADLVTLNEVDLGMARSGNRDVAAELCVRLGMHAAWAAMFLESTRGRDDDSLTALASDNAESLFGLALLSRWPIAAARLVTLPGPERTLFERERMTGRFVALVC